MGERFDTLGFAGASRLAPEICQSPFSVTTPRAPLKTLQRPRKGGEGSGVWVNGESPPPPSNRKNEVQAPGIHPGAGTLPSGLHRSQVFLLIANTMLSVTLPRFHWSRLGPGNPKGGDWERRSREKERERSKTHLSGFWLSSKPWDEGSLQTLSLEPEPTVKEGRLRSMDVVRAVQYCPFLLAAPG